MQTIYYADFINFIRHEGNLVDLAAYRQKLAAVSGGNWSPAPEGSRRLRRGGAPRARERCQACPEEAPQRRARRTGETAPPCRPALDFCASAAIVVLTVSAVIGFLHLQKLSPFLLYARGLRPRKFLQFGSRIFFTLHPEYDNLLKHVKRV